MARRAVPQIGMEYTFKFRKCGLTHKTTLIFNGVNEKGRCEFFNVQSNAFTSMTPKRFAYIHRFNLTSEGPARDIERPTLKEVPRNLIEDNISITDDDVPKEAQKIIKHFRSLNQVQRVLVQKAIGRNVDNFISDLELYFASNSEEVIQRLQRQGIMLEWMRAEDALRVKLTSLTCKVEDGICTTFQI